MAHHSGAPIRPVRDHHPAAVLGELRAHEVNKVVFTLLMLWLRHKNNMIPHAAGGRRAFFGGVAGQPLTLAATVKQLLTVIASRARLQRDQAAVSVAPRPR